MLPARFVCTSCELRLSQELANTSNNIYLQYICECFLNQ